MLNCRNRFSGYRYVGKLPLHWPISTNLSAFLGESITFKISPFILRILFSQSSKIHSWQTFNISEIFSTIGIETLRQLLCDLLFPCSATAVPLTQRVLNRIWNLTDLFQVAFSTCNYHVSCTSKSKWFGCKHPIRLDRRQGAALVVITNHQQSRDCWD